MLNRVILMGRLTNEPDYRQTQGGTSYARFTMAIERDYSKDGNRETDFLDVLAWRSTADFVSKYFHKGQLVAVQGRIQTGSYTDKDGNKRKSWDIVADQVYFAESKRDSGGRDVNVERDDEPSAGGDFVPVADDDLPF